MPHDAPVPTPSPDLAATVAGAAAATWVSVIVVKAVSDALRDHGGADKVLDSLSDVHAAFLFDPRARMPRSEFLGWLETARSASGTPQLGLALGERLTESSFDVLGPMIMTSVSARQAVTAFLELRKTTLGGPEWELSVQGDQVTLGFVHEPALGTGAQVEAEISLALAYQTAERFWGARARESVSVQFAYPAPLYVDSYRAIFGDRVSFGGALNCLLCPLALLDRPRPGVTPGLAQAWQQFATNHLQPPIDGTWSARVERTLKSARNLAEVDFEQLASRWNLSLRTLRRKLEAESTSISALLETARFERAREQLARRTLSLSDIAQSLGYFEVSSFQRAFKRWSGVAPGRFRRQAQREAPDR